MKRRVLSTAGRHILLSGIGVSFACLIVAGNAGADPGTTIPDTGARPAPGGGVVSLPGQPATGGLPTGGLPTGGTIPGAGSPTGGSPTGGFPTGTGALPAATNLVLGPLATQIMTETRAVETLGEQRKQAEDNAKTARRTAEDARLALATAKATLTDLQSKADSAAAEAYKHAVGLGPFSRYASQLHNLSSRSAALPRQPGGSGEALDVARATAEVQTAERTYHETDSIAASLETKSGSIAAEHQQRSVALEDLKSRNTPETVLANAQRDTYEQNIGGGYTGDLSVDGSVANPKALDAVRFALAQLGKPYVWATEGPSTYDCSGLALAAYRSVGASLPRIANTQYRSTTPVSVSRTVKGDLLVPGDLLFFSTDPGDWTQIHHVGIYIGGGRMVHAPHTGDVVKISPVWWSEFFGATRVFPALIGPTTLPGPAPVGIPGPNNNGAAPATGGSSHDPGNGGTQPGGSGGTSESPAETPPPSSSGPSEPSSPSASPSSSSASPSTTPMPAPPSSGSSAANTPSGSTTSSTGDQNAGSSDAASSTN